MTVSEVLSVLWHRKLTVGLVTVLALAAAFVGLRAISPVYESCATMSLNPNDIRTNNFGFFQTIDPIITIYASAADTKVAEAAARAKLGGRLADISVRTYASSPIFKICGRSSDRGLAQRSPQVTADLLLSAAAAGRVGIPGLRLQQIDRPTYPTSPVFPSKKLTYGVALLLGLGFGIAAAFLREPSGMTIRSRKDLAEASGLPVYAELSTEKSLREGNTLIALTSDRALLPFNEALRELRTNLALSESGIRSITVTSPEGGHGKTTVAVALALAIARTGARTILVDADLRRGVVAERVGLPSIPGLREALSGTNATLEAAVEATAVDNLDVLASGRRAAEPGELLATNMPQVLKQLELDYDAVVVDTTPLVPVNDARILASQTNATLLVVGAGKASQRSVREALESLALLSVRPVAAVLNGSKKRSPRPYYSSQEQRAADVDLLRSRSVGARGGPVGKQ